jgi:2-polyprenyl-3-methyl-5-hydroxy-6-metoxy-1,4-benzoquinol methylase
MQETIVKGCTVCHSRHIHYAFTKGNNRIVQCNSCGFMFINPQPSTEILSNIYDEQYFINHTSDLKKSTATLYLDILLGKGHRASGNLLEIGCGNGDLLSVAADRGLRVTGVELSPVACATAQDKLKDYNGKIIQGEINILSGQKQFFDYVVVNDVLEHVRDPRNFLQTVYELLKVDGKLFCVVPSLDSWSARLLKTNWMEFKTEHLSYFDTKNLRSILFQEGFSEIKHFPAKKFLSADYILSHFKKYSVPFWSSLLCLLYKFVPEKISRKPIKITASGIGMIANKRNKERDLILSVIMPAYNEVATIKAGIERVLSKSIIDIDIELIIVESNSTDGTRKIALDYTDHPQVTVLLEDKPRGKGYAVRTGLKNATGDFILIQDADDEYDIEDYDALIEHLRDGREAFVLGARHGGGNFKMRKFADQPVRAFILNFGHWTFTLLVNIFYGVRLRDPFTMYKVFRRECIHDLVFECNQFDFDYELLIKLIRKGFIPLEIPVNYRSRSFAEGKKVRIFADPLTWIKAIVKYRFAKI